MTTVDTTPPAEGRDGVGTPIDECLSIRDGRLFIEGCDAVQLACRFGTPLHVVSENHLRRNVRRWGTAFRERWPEGTVNVLPSFKANLSLALRRILTEEGAGCDTFGPAELEAALRCGTPPRLISVNGSTKDAELVRRAVDVGARITLDDASELELVGEAARAAGRRARIRFRIRPDYSELERPTDFASEEVTIRQAAQRYKAGIPTEDVLPLGPRALAMDEIELTGLMAHLGRHHRGPEVWRGMVRGFVALVAELSRAWDGWEPRELDLGGGFASPRDPTGRGVAWSRGRPDEGTGPSVEDYAAVVTDTLREELARHGLHASGKTLEIEPGRAIYADAGIHLATVRNVKSQTTPTPLRWVETDTTEMFLPDVLIEHDRWTTVVAGRADAALTMSADVVGRSCGFDVIVPDERLPQVGRGDVIAFLDTGAYQDAASSNFNGLPRPATVLVRNDRAEIIKRAETIDDVFARDLPSRTPKREGVTAPRLDHVSVTAGDIDRSIRFYRNVLGLRLLARGESEGPEISAITGFPGTRLRWAELDLGRDQILELLQYLQPAGTPLEQRTCDPGSSHISLAVDNIDEIYGRVRSSGVPARSKPVELVGEDGRWAGARCLYLSDPDGVTVELIERPLERRIVVIPELEPTRAEEG